MQQNKIPVKKIIIGLLVLLIVLIGGCKNYNSEVIYDEGFVLKAGEEKYWAALDARIYKFEISADNGVDIYTFISENDYNLWKTGEKAGYYSSCSAENSTTFNKECQLNQGAVLVIVSPSSLSEASVFLRISEGISP